MEVVKFMSKMHNDQISEILLPSFKKFSATHSCATRNALSNNVYIPKTLHAKTDQLIRVSGQKYEMYCLE